MIEVNVFKRRRHLFSFMLAAANIYDTFMTQTRRSFLLCHRSNSEAKSYFRLAICFIFIYLYISFLSLLFVSLSPSLFSYLFNFFHGVLDTEVVFGIPFFLTLVTTTMSLFVSLVSLAL